MEDGIASAALWEVKVRYHFLSTACQPESTDVSLSLGNYKYYSICLHITSSRLVIWIIWILMFQNDSGTLRCKRIKHVGTIHICQLLHSQGKKHGFHFLNFTILLFSIFCFWLENNMSSSLTYHYCLPGNFRDNKSMELKCYYSKNVSVTLCKTKSNSSWNDGSDWTYDGQIWIF